MLTRKALVKSALYTENNGLAILGKLRMDSYKNKVYPSVKHLPHTEKFKQNVGMFR